MMRYYFVKIILTAEMREIIGTCVKKRDQLGGYFGNGTSES
jgi:hypothetical protein